MDKVQTLLQGIFGFVVYPAVIIGVFAFISVVIKDFVLSVSGERRIRRLVAAALPLAVIVFALVPPGGGGGGVQELLDFAVPWVRFLVGGLLGVAALAVGRALAKRDSDIAAAIYVLFLSAVASFILYCLVEGVLRNLHLFLLGLVLGGGLYVVFRGPPSLSPAASKQAEVE